MNAERLDWREHIWVGTFEDGSQILVKTWHDHDTSMASMAVRQHSAATWGPPIIMEYRS
jgi:hypothetical protein